MPAESEAQRRYLFAVKGAPWVNAHHFNNKGPLPARVGMARGGFVTVPPMRSGPYGQRGTGYATPPYHRELPQYMTENLAPQFSGSKNRLPQYQEGGVATGAVGPNTMRWKDKFIRIPGFNKLFHLTDYGPGVPGIDIPVRNQRETFDPQFNRSVNIPGIGDTRLTGYNPGGGGIEGGLFDTHGDPIIRYDGGPTTPPGPTAYQSPDGTWTGSPYGPQDSSSSSGAVPSDTIFSDSNGLWNAPTEPGMTLSDPYTGGIPGDSIDGIGLPPLSTSEQISQTPDAALLAGDPTAASIENAQNPSSLSLGPLINSEGNYQLPNAPTAGPSATPSMDYPGGIGNMDNYDPTFNYGGGADQTSGPFGGGDNTNFGNLPVSDLSSRPLDSWTQAAFAPSSMSGSGGPTQRGVGMAVGTLSNLFIPGSGFITGPLARLLTRYIQGQGGSGGDGGGGANSEPPADNPDKVGGSPQGPAGGLGIPSGYSPFGGLPPGFTEQRNPQGAFGAPNFYGPGEGPQTGTPQFIGDSINTSGAPGSPFNNPQAGALWSPPGGSIGGPLGGPTGGGFGTDLLGRLSGLALMRGQDPGLGEGWFSGQPAAPSGAGGMALAPGEVSQYFHPNFPVQAGSGGVPIHGPDLPMMHAFAGGGVADDNDPTDLQGRERTNGPITPEEMDFLWKAQQRYHEQQRAAAMNEGNPYGYSGGGLVQRRRTMQEPQGNPYGYTQGGMVQPTAQPLQGYGTDTVPAALTPGEVVLNRKQQAAVMPRPGYSGRLKPDQLRAIHAAMTHGR